MYTESTGSMTSAQMYQSRVICMITYWSMYLQYILWLTVSGDAHGGALWIA